MERPSPESQPPSGAATPLNGLLNNLSLNGERLNINASPALAPLLEQTLGKTDQRYRWHANNGQHQHVLLDRSGRLLNVQDSPLAFTAIAHSKPVAPEQQPRMDRAGQRIALLHNGVREHRPLPDQAVQSMLTGIFSHQRADGAQTEHLRLHEKRLHRFDESSQRWEPTHGVDEKPSISSAARAITSSMRFRATSVCTTSAASKKPDVR
ncbi:AvrE-family type 3 secretion system effector [Enterobacter hormaechei]|nr:AvrE-family type 3 secretion system effector [Enterobacter hormaechei]